MHIYIITRHGIYMQGIVGVYDTISKAKRVLKEAQAKEGDDYHSFHISKEELNREITQELIKPVLYAFSWHRNK